MAAFLIADNIHVHVVTSLQHVRVRHAMRHHIVDRGAQAFRVVHEVYSRRIGPILDYIVVGDLVYFIETHPNFSLLDHLRHCSCCQIRSLSEGCDLFWSEDMDGPMERGMILADTAYVRRPFD